VVDDRSERRRLARAGRSRHEHESAVLIGETLDRRRKREIGKPRRLAWDDPKRKRHRTALAEGVDPKPRQARRRVGEIKLPGLLEALVPLRCARRERPEHEVQIGDRHVRGSGERRDVAVAPQERRATDLKVNVRCVSGNGVGEQCVELHGDGVGRPAVAL